NGSKNLKITGLTSGTTIKMQLDLTGFDYNTKTGAKMTITWTVPSTEAPTDAPTPTEAPTDAPVPTEAPTDAPTPGEKLTVTVVSLDGVEDTKTFDIGETFTVYTTLNTSAYENGGISALNGSQSYKVDFLEFADKYDSDTGDILNPEEVFPVVGDDMVANGKTPGTIKFNASTISLKNPYRFDDNNDILVKTQYKVKAPGETRIVTEMLTLAIADQPLTKIINQGVVQDGYENFRMHSSFTWPEENPTEAPTDAPVPTEAPTDAPVPTEAPTDAPVPTEAPTDAPVPTEAPTEAPKPTEAPVGKATVIVSGLDGESETKEFNVGDSFTVYTTLNTSAYENGGIDAIDGSQTYTASVLSLVDEYDPEGGEILNPADMFPVTGDDMIANGKTSGKITFNASQASIKDPYRFGSDASVLIQSHYTVTAPGTAEIKTTLKTLAIADEPLTKIIDQGEIQDGYKNFRLHSSFIEPALQPTTAPTEAPKPTETPVTITDGYYLVGTMTDWKADPAYKFSENTANPGEYMLSTTLASGDGIKALKVENGAITAWYPNGMGDEYNVDAAHAGDVTVYFKPTYQSDWSAFGGYLYIDGGSAPTPDMITVKFTNTNNWGAVYAYCWYEDGNEPLGGWSGTLMTKESGNIYSVQIPANTYGLIFNDGNTYQTVDIGDGITDGAHWKLSGQMDGTNYKVVLVTDTPEPTTAPEPSKNYVYLAPHIWDVADATERFQLYIWNDGGDELWLTGTLVGGKYQFEIPTGFTDGTFVRMDSAKPVDDWGSMWNQTVDVTLNIGKTYTIDSWDVDQGKSGGSWS
ncbi:starch-binding protein, partial [Ruminococcus sp.]|uniref:starch-binding protein n=1 Tax=Ruminococcus sp. TaxID=41978 RepID=UPI00386B5531